MPFLVASTTKSVDTKHAQNLQESSGGRDPDQSAARGFHAVTVVEVEEEAAHVFVVDFPAAIRLILRDDLQAEENFYTFSFRRRCGRHIWASLQSNLLCTDRLKKQTNKKKRLSSSFEHRLDTRFIDRNGTENNQSDAG